MQFRSVYVFALVVLSASAVKADATDMMMTITQKAMELADYCLTPYGIEVGFDIFSSFSAMGNAMKAMAACPMRAAGLIDENGNFNMERITSLIPDAVPFKKMIVTVLEHCIPRAANQENALDKVVEVGKCIGHEKLMKSAAGKMISKGMRMFNMFFR